MSGNLELLCMHMSHFHRTGFAQTIPTLKLNPTSLYLGDDVLQLRLQYMKPQEEDG